MANWNDPFSTGNDRPNLRPYLRPHFLMEVGHHSLDLAALDLDRYNHHAMDQHFVSYLHHRRGTSGAAVSALPYPPPGHMLAVMANASASLSSSSLSRQQQQQQQQQQRKSPQQHFYPPTQQTLAVPSSLFLHTTSNKAATVVPTATKALPSLFMWSHNSRRRPQLQPQQGYSNQQPLHLLSVTAGYNSRCVAPSKQSLPATTSPTSTFTAKNLADWNGVVQEPKDQDVLLGRGGRSNHHFGNERYRQLIRQQRQHYHGLPKHEKIRMSRAIVGVVHDLGGRFLEPAPNSKGKYYVAVSGKRAVEKTSQCLREKRGETTAFATATSSRNSSTKAAAAVRPGAASPTTSSSSGSSLSTQAGTTSKAA